MKLVMAWLLLSVGMTLLIALIAGISTSNGAQWPLVIVANAIVVILIGGLVLSLASPFIYPSWSKKYWYAVTAMIFLFAAPIYIYFS